MTRLGVLSVGFAIKRSIKCFARLLSRASPKSILVNAPVTHCAAFVIKGVKQRTEVDDNSTEFTRELGGKLKVVFARNAM